MKSRRRLFLLMWSRTPPISSEFRGGAGLNTPTPPPLQYATVWNMAKRRYEFCWDLLPVNDEVGRRLFRQRQACLRVLILSCQYRTNTSFWTIFTPFISRGTVKLELALIYDHFTTIWHNKTLGYNLYFTSQQGKIQADPLMNWLHINYQLDALIIYS